MSKPLADNPYPALFGDASIVSEMPRFEETLLLFSYTDHLAHHQDHAVAGFGAGTVATLVMHPLDLIKVRFQLATVPRISPSAAYSSSTTSLQSSLASSSRHSSIPGVIPTSRARLGTGVYHALRDAVVLDGWKGLYRGLGPNLVGGASSWGLYFLL